MKELVIGAAIFVVVLAFLSNAQATLDFRTESKAAYDNAKPNALFTPAGLVNGGLEGMGKQPEKQKARVDLSVEMQVPERK